MSNGNSNNGRRSSNGLAAILTVAAAILGYIAGIMTVIIQSIFFPDNLRRRKKLFKKMKHYDSRLLNEMA
jgi:hypothetical protein